MLTFALVATSKVLPASFYNVSVACLAASLMVMVSYNLSSQASLWCF
jgi:hypothetical protein